MSTSINWEKLVSQNRAKAHGIPWNDREMDAIYNKGIDPEKVRRGILTKEDEEKEERSLDGKMKPWIHEKTQGLINLAKELGVNFDESAVGRNDLMKEIKKVKEEEDMTNEAVNKINQAVNG